MKVNWPEQTSGSKIYPKGLYTVKLKSWERTTAKTGTEQIRWKAEIVEGPAAIGKQITEHTPLTEKGVWRTAKMMQSFGFDLTTLGEMDTDSAEFSKAVDKCVNRRSIWHVVQDTHNGKPKNDILDYMEPNDQEAMQPVVKLEDLPDWLKEHSGGDNAAV